MTKSHAEALQIDLLDVIEGHGLNVSVGLFREEGGEWGVSITSRQPDVYVASGGPVVYQ